MLAKLIDSNQWKKAFSRILLVGPAYSWKTSSLVTFPKPIRGVVFPGELGLAALDPSVELVAFEDDPAKPTKPRKAYKEVWQETADILAGKRGPLTTFAGDGLHKLYTLIYAANYDEMIDPNDDEKEIEKKTGRVYGRSHSEFREYLNMVCSSSVERVVFTIWDGSTKDNAKIKERDAPSHIWPDLPGQLAKTVVGEFGCVLYSIAGQDTGAGKFTQGRWQTRRMGEVWGVGIKAPLHIASRIPTMVPQDWQALEQLAFAALPTNTAATTTKGESK